MKPGTYRFEFESTNRAKKTDEAGLWTMGTFVKATEFGNTPPVDKELVAVGFQVTGPMAVAGWFPLTLEELELLLCNEIMFSASPPLNSA